MRDDIDLEIRMEVALRWREEERELELLRNKVEIDALKEQYGNKQVCNRPPIRKGIQHLK